MTIDTVEPSFCERFEAMRTPSPTDGDIAYCALRGDYFRDPFREAAGLALAASQQGTTPTHSELPSGTDDLFLPTLTAAKETDARQHDNRH